MREPDFRVPEPGVRLPVSAKPPPIVAVDLDGDVAAPVIVAALVSGNDAVAVIKARSRSHKTSPRDVATTFGGF